MTLLFYTAVTIGGLIFIAVLTFVILVIVAAAGGGEDMITPVCLLTGETRSHMDEDCRECAIAEEARKIGDR